MDCPICFSEASDTTNSCNHSFHQACLDIWLNGHDTCPYCRYNIIIERYYPANINDSNISIHYDSDSDSDVEPIGSDNDSNNESGIYNSCNEYYEHERDGWL